MDGAGYSLYGSNFKLSGVAPIPASESITIDNHIDFTETSTSVIFSIAEGKTVEIVGNVKFNITNDLAEVRVGNSLSPRGTLKISGIVSGTVGQGIKAQGPSTLDLSGANTYVVNSASLVVMGSGAWDGGKFICRNDACLGDPANDGFFNSGTLEVRTTNLDNDLIFSGSNENTISGMSSTTLGGEVAIVGSGRLNISDTAMGQLSLNNDVVFGSASGKLRTSGGTVVFSDPGKLIGSGDVEFGADTTRMYGLNTGYDGDITVKDGAILEARTYAALGSATGDTTVEDGGSVVFINTGSPMVVSENFNISGSGVDSSVGAITFGTGSSDSVTLTGDIVLLDDAVIQSNVPNTSGSMYLSGVISGDAGLTLTQTEAIGNIRLEGSASNTYTGDTTVIGGIVLASKTGGAIAIPGNLFIDQTSSTTGSSEFYSPQSSPSIASSAVVTFFGNSYLTLTEDQVLAGIVSNDGEGRILFHTDGVRLVIDQSFDSTFGGEFIGSNSNVYDGIGTLEKKGSGVLTLTGDYSVATDFVEFVVSEGTLVINGEVWNTAGGGDVTVNGGKLKGTGIIRNLSSTSGVIAPGNSPGILSVVDATLSSDTSFQVEINGSVAGSEYDQLIASGSVDLANVALDIVPGYTPEVGTVFSIIQATSVTGQFSGLPDGSTVSVDGLSFRVNYTETEVLLTFLGGELATSDSIVDNVSLLKTGQTTLAIIASAVAVLTISYLGVKQKTSDTQ